MEIERGSVWVFVTGGEEVCVCFIYERVFLQLHLLLPDIYMYGVCVFVCVCVCVAGGNDR